MAELVAQDAPAWSQFVRDYDGAHRAFLENRNALVQLGPYIQTRHPELLSQYQSLLQRANDLAPKLQMLADTRAKVGSWLGALGTVYQSAVDATSRAIETAAGLVGAARRALGLGELGVVPLVVVGVAAAAGLLALITKWVSDAFLFSRRLNMLQELEAKGYSPDQAAAAVNKAVGPPNAPGSLERTLSTALWLVVLGLVGVPIVMKLLDSGGRRSEA